MSYSKCAACSSKKSRFMKEQEAKKILSSLGSKTPLNKFHYKFKYCFSLYSLKNEWNSK